MCLSQCSHEHVFMSSESKETALVMTIQINEPCSFTSFLQSCKYKRLIKEHIRYINREGVAWRISSTFYPYISPINRQNLFLLFVLRISLNTHISLVILPPQYPYLSVIVPRLKQMISMFVDLLGKPGEYLRFTRKPLPTKLHLLFDFRGGKIEG